VNDTNTKYKSNPLLSFLEQTKMTEKISSFLTQPIKFDNDYFFELNLTNQTMKDEIPIVSQFTTGFDVCQRFKFLSNQLKNMKQDFGETGNNQREIIIEELNVLIEQYTSERIK
jgi:hypothetical protein